MSPRFHRDESVEAGFRRIALAQIDTALAALDDAALSPARRIHAVRAQCKALRALLRLVRPGFAGFAAMDAAIREIARRLAPARDAQVLSDTVALLLLDKDEGGDDADAAARATLAAGCGDGAGQAEAIETCRALLLDLHGHAARWTLGATGWDALAGGARRTCRKARRAMRKARRGDAEASHKWRRHVKYHWHHVRLLRAIDPGAMAGRARGLRKLGDRLGLRHDIDVLLDALRHDAAPFGGAAAVERLRALARRRSARLDKRARRLGEGLFDAKPRALIARWGEAWHAWTGRAPHGAGHGAMLNGAA